MRHLEEVVLGQRLLGQTLCVLRLLLIFVTLVLIEISLQLVIRTRLVVPTFETIASGTLFEIGVFKVISDRAALDLLLHRLLLQLVNFWSVDRHVKAKVFDRSNGLLPCERAL